MAPRGSQLWAGPGAAGLARGLAHSVTYLGFGKPGEAGCQGLLSPRSPGVFQGKLNPHVSDLLTLTAHLKVVLQEWFGPKELRGTLMMIIFHFETQTCPLT